MAKAPHTTRNTQSNAGNAGLEFAIDDGVTVPNRTKDLPEYGLEEIFARMKPGQSVLIPFSKVPVEHIRTLVGRFARAGGPKDVKGKPTKVDMVTRSERAPGDTEGDFVAMRVWRNS